MLKAQMLREFVGRYLFFVVGLISEFFSHPSHTSAKKNCGKNKRWCEAGGGYRLHPGEPTELLGRW